jgi:hypothetical protein
MNLKSPFLLLLICFSLCSFAQESPVQGDDLLKVLGQNKNSDFAVQLNEYIGNKSTKEDISFLNYGKGVQVNIEESKIKKIDLYNDENPYSTEFKKFQGKLPLDLSFENTIHQAKMKIGEGYEVTGDVMGIYQVNKTMKLNDDDDYRLSVEFTTGRMVSVSLTYLEAGEGAAEGEEGGEEKPVNNNIFKGNDFFTMMHKNTYNRQFVLFTRLFYAPAHKDATKMIYVKEGVDIRFEDDAIQSITLYSGGQQSDYKGMTFGTYVFDLPHGMRMENTRSGVLKKLGTPVSDNGSVVTYRERAAELQIAFKGEKIDWVKIIAAEAPKLEYVPPVKKPSTNN